jgi:two-component system invasion response regulator UvrY
MNPILTLLVDDNSDFLQSAAEFLSAHPEISVVGRAAAGDEAINQVRKLKPDLVLLDLRMPGINGLEAARRIKQLAHPPRIVILTIHNGPDYRARAEEAGADGFVGKSQMGVDLLPLLQVLFPGNDLE